jgi:hypothetical protein
MNIDPLGILRTGVRGTASHREKEAAEMSGFELNG